VAGQALAAAEKAFEDDSDSYQTRDLAYVAQRKSQMAEVTASIVIEKKRQSQAKDDYGTTQGEIVTKTKSELGRTSRALEASKRDSRTTAKRVAVERAARDAADQQASRTTADRISAERAAREAADQRAADAQAALAKLAAVKAERRGMVITLSGSVLFASGQSTLLPAARAQLGKVATVLLQNDERHLTIEGHTDSQGSDGYNRALSQRRADAVRSFLEQRGYRANRMVARGMGEGSPIADNTSAEGRANNRRVEIVIDNPTTSSR
jgi:outer membrane protein OmpA-like peptidoglycan-associated protein